MLPDNHPPDDGPVLELPPPLLIVDWGVEPQAGNHLSPEFHLVAPGYRSRPRVIAVLDRFLDQGDWQTNPWLTERDESHWSFHQPLDLTHDGQVCRYGQYLLKLHVVFPEPGPSGIRCYRAEVRITVPDAAATTSPVLEIRGTGSTLVNLQGIDINRYAKIVVEGSEQSVVNVLHQNVAGTTEQATAELHPKPDERLVLRLPLDRDRELHQLLPSCTRRHTAPPLAAASLVSDDGVCIHLLAHERVILGRDRSGTSSSDIMLRLLPLDENRWILSRLISRRHLRLTLHAEGLQLEDCRATFGTYFNGQQLADPLTVTQSASGWLQRHTLDVAGVLSLEVTLHGDRGWDGWSPYCDTGPSFYAAAAGCHPPPLWELACQSRIDAVRLRRRAGLPLARYLDRIKQILLPGHREQWESVSRAAASIQPIDHLAAREQYVLVYRTATIGGGDQAVISLPGAGLGDVAARILHLGGGFWLEALADEQATYLDERPAPRQELIPLAPGNRLRFGTTTLTFTDFQQTQE